MRFVLGRLAHSALVLLSVSVLTFALIELSPGEFFDDLKVDAKVGSSTVRLTSGTSAAMNASWDARGPW